MPKGDRITAIHRGLPHPIFEKREFAAELLLSRILTIHGYPFENNPLQDDEPLRANLAKLLTDKATFAPYLGAKGCGGYHADFAARFGEPTEERWVLVCLGCHEAIFFSPEGELHCDLGKENAKALENEWRPQEKSR